MITQCAELLRGEVSGNDLPVYPLRTTRATETTSYGDILITGRHGQTGLDKVMIKKDVKERGHVLNVGLL